MAMACSWLVLLVTMHLMLYSFVCREARDARHHGWFRRSHLERGHYFHGPLHLTIPFSITWLEKFKKCGFSES